jgi:hypothetical protein
VLPVGQYCQAIGITQCGTFRTVGGGKVNWQECNAHGHCIQNATVTTPRCFCDKGYSGATCEIAQCIGCSGNTQCNTVTGMCECKPFWGSPLGCSANDPNCQRCSINLCGHGYPATYDEDTHCVCEDFWRTGSDGKCTVPFCPLVVKTPQGVRACEPSDTLCPSLVASTTTQALSLQTECCYDACGSNCVVNTTTGLPFCKCAPGVAFVQQDGICYPKCSGQPYTVTGGKLTCDCSALVSGLKANEFIDPATCNITACLNGGIANGLGGCDCSATIYTGPRCEVDRCGERGVLNSAGTGCICSPPFLALTPGLCDGDACAGGNVFEISPGNFKCNCTEDSFVGTGSMSCSPLNCAATPTLCAKCLHGSRAYLLNHQVACDCTGTGYTGPTCLLRLCDNGGVADTVTGECICPFPYSGELCQQELCEFGYPSIANPNPGQAGSCECLPGYNGTFCTNFTSMYIANFTEPTNFLPHSSSSSTAAAIISGNATSSHSIDKTLIYETVFPIAGGLVLIGAFVLVSYLNGWLCFSGTTYAAMPATGGRPHHSGGGGGGHPQPRSKITGKYVNMPPQRAG